MTDAPAPDLPTADPSTETVRSTGGFCTPSGTAFDPGNIYRLGDEIPRMIPGTIPELLDLWAADIDQAVDLTEQETRHGARERQLAWAATMGKCHRVLAETTSPDAWVANWLSLHRRHNEMADGQKSKRDRKLSRRIAGAYGVASEELRICLNGGGQVPLLPTTLVPRGGIRYYPVPPPVFTEPDAMPERLEHQVQRLAVAIMNELPGEPSQSEGAVDTAIRCLGHRMTGYQIREAMDAGHTVLIQVLTGGDASWWDAGRFTDDHPDGIPAQHYAEKFGQLCLVAKIDPPIR